MLATCACRVIFVLFVVSCIELREGDRLTLSCSISPDAWTLLTTGLAATIVDYRPSSGTFGCAGPWLSGGAMCRDGIIIDTDKGREIIIQSVIMNDAGIYTCTSNDLSESTNVIVLSAGGPRLNVSLESPINVPALSCSDDVLPGDLILFNCTIRYAGAHTPNMQLIFQDQGGKVAILSRTETDTDATPFLLNATVSVHFAFVLLPTDRNLSISCTLPDVDKSSPMLLTRQFQTVYGPEWEDLSSNDTIFLQQAMIQLNCTALSYPVAEYKWFTRSGAQLVQLSEQGGALGATEEGEYCCKATNARTNSTIQKTFFIIRIETTTMTSSSSLATTEQIITNSDTMTHANGTTTSNSRPSPSVNTTLRVKDSPPTSSTFNATSEDGYQVVRIVAIAAAAIALVALFLAVTALVVVCMKRQHD